jgi:hypothetical protein
MKTYAEYDNRTVTVTVKRACTLRRLKELKMLHILKECLRNNRKQNEQQTYPGAMPTVQNQHINRHLHAAYITYRRVNYASTWGPRHYTSGTTCILCVCTCRLVWCSSATRRCCPDSRRPRHTSRSAIFQ